MTVLSTNNHQTEFEKSSFTRSKDMTKIISEKDHYHVTMTMPILRHAHNTLHGLPLTKI